MHPNFDRDDHNSPAFYVREDGSLLTVYARHSTENKHYYRISNTDNYLQWGPEQTIEHDDSVTYMNLVRAC
ncbi:BNR-4 repeat-containing protein [Alteromonas pelagimontana]|uniref:BNR-4 repeat-containing protein n=1 Tax=Alteromonas pelagimontana TaxID=1858656 RepID=UPI00094F7537|nr:BNR-4 repeat-containing protein [Alteromonas pelagimontana]